MVRPANVAALLGITIALAWLAVSGAKVVVPSAPPAPVDKLDKLYAAKDWNALGAALYPGPDVADSVKAYHWLRRKVDSGGNFYMAMLLARDFWEIGNAANVADADIDDVNRDPRMTAGMMSLYAFALISIDGAECADSSAPANRFHQLVQLRARTLRYLASRPQPVKERMAKIAVGLESRTAPLRAHDDDLLCRGGLAMFMAGGKQHEVPTPAGYVGKTIAVEPPPGWKPSYLPPEVYGPKQAEIRAGLRQRLQALVAAAGKP